MYSPPTTNSTTTKTAQNKNSFLNTGIKVNSEPIEVKREQNTAIAEISQVVSSPVKKPTGRGRRTSVSAESMTPTTGETYEKIVIPKSDEQKSRIKDSIRQNFVFKSLDDEQYIDVVNAMAEKTVVEGEEIIKQGAVGDYFYCIESGIY